MIAVLIVIGIAIISIVATVWSWLFGGIGVVGISVLVVIAFIWFGQSALLIIEEKEKELQRKAEESAYERACAVVREKVAEHFEALHLKKSQLVYKGDYGEWRFERYNAELKRFIGATFPPGFQNVFPSDGHLIEFIDQSLISEIRRRETSGKLTEVMQFHGGMSGLEYEAYCRELLVEAGFDCRTTSITGDQGVDLLVKTVAGDVVVQCKISARPIGNSAVQEVAAGRDYYNATYAVVVSNATFTPSARTLAAACGVDLLHHSELVSMIQGAVSATA